MNSRSLALCLLVFSLLSIIPTSNQLHAQTPISATLIKSGLSRPIFVTAPPGDYGRLFIVEQRGSNGTSNRADIRIMNLSTYALNSQPFLTVSPVNTGSEEGLLGLAFHPDYANNRYFFTYHTNTSGNNVVTRWQTLSGNPDVADPTSATTILTISHPVESNHNGGWIGFGPDGYLYIATGDGGGGGDQNNNAQNLNSLLGKILRLDIDGNLPYEIPPSNPFFGLTIKQEVFYWGLRNPWRDSFDRETGEFYIGDVGQNVWEEIDWRPASDSGNINFGWRLREGMHCYNPSTNCDPGGITRDPIHEYSHAATGGCSITGGYVYRGCAIPDLRGTYFFGDYCSGDVWTFRWNGTVMSEFQNRQDSLGLAGVGNLVSFGEDGFGEMYLIYQSGQIYKIVPDAGITDCNTNNFVDSCEISVGLVPDANGNWIPDSCDPTGPVCGDADGNLTVTISDVVYLITYIFAGGPAPSPLSSGDADCNSIVNISDAVYLISYIFSGGPAPCASCP